MYTAPQYLDTVISEGSGGVPKQSDGAQHVGHHHRLEHVQLEVTVTPSHRHRHVVTHHLQRQYSSCGISYNHPEGS